MRTLVSGASGFIGRALVARLETDGHTVLRVVRRPPEAGEAAIDLPGRRLDLSKLPGGSLDGIDAVFHLAGEPLSVTRWSPAKRERLRASRVTTTDLLARAIATADEPPQVLVSMSAVGYYGERGDEVLDEGSAAGEGFLAELCRAWEAATGPARDRGVRVVTCRSGVVLGPGGLLAALVPSFRLGLGARLGSGWQWLSWISLEDEVGALLHAATHEELAGACNLTSPSPVRYADFVAALAAALHRPAFLSVPRPLLTLALGRRVVDEFLCASDRALPRRLGATGYAFAHDNLASAIAAGLAALSGPSAR